MPRQIDSSRGFGAKARVRNNKWTALVANTQGLTYLRRRRGLRNAVVVNGLGARVIIVAFPLVRLEGVRHM
jgi:hypothetical protein